MTNNKVLSVLKKNAMLIVLVLVYIFFTVMTSGQMFQPMNFNALITQNAYVFMLATGMLMCMLTGGNIDLSCGSFVCFLGAIGGILMMVKQMNPGVSIDTYAPDRRSIRMCPGLSYSLCEYSPVDRNTGRIPCIQRLGYRTPQCQQYYRKYFPCSTEGFPCIFSGKVFSTPWVKTNMVCLMRLDL